MKSTLALTHRPYAGRDDLARMKEMVRARYAAAIADGIAVGELPWYPSPGDLVWWVCTTNEPDLGQVVELWFEDDRLTGFVWHSRDEAEIVLDWGAREQYPTLLEWSEQQSLVRQSEKSQGKAIRFELPVLERNTELRSLLQARGYVQTERTHMQDHYFDLTTNLPALRTLPPGFTIRTLEGAHELEARVSVHRAAFAPSRMTVSKHLCVLQSDEYQHGFDLVVQAPEWPEGVAHGEEGCSGDLCFAAYALVWYDEMNRRGVFEPVGCRPEFQRRGLASAVLAEGMHRLHALGATHAWIGAWGDSPGAHTYRALGGQPAQRYNWFARELAPSSGLISPTPE